MKVISQGIATGYIKNLNKANYNLNIVCSNYEKEEELLTESIKKVEKKLIALKNNTTKNVKDIIEIYLAFLKDSSVNDEIYKLIKSEQFCAGVAYEKVIDKYAEILGKSNDVYLKERANDFLDLKDKVLKEMYLKTEELSFKRPTILVVDYLTTSLSLSLPKEVKAVISKKGGELSHAAIVMKEKNIPFIISDEKLVDDKIIHINTDIEKLEEVQELKEEENKNKYSKEFLEKAKTLKTKLYLNMSTLDDLNNETNVYYEGVGLVRSEHLFIKDYPYLKTQIKYYKKILSEFYPKKVRIRLFDIKKDKGEFVLINEEVSEFKFKGEHNKLYKEQLKALILANEAFNTLEIVIPMVKSIDEYNNVKNYLNSLKEELSLIREVPNLGIMLETKKALYNIEEYKDVSFVNIGTNDLVKELFEINREETFERQKIIKKVLKEVEEAKQYLIKENIPYIFCGDLVSTEFGLNILLKNGEKALSIADGFLYKAIKTIINNEA